MPALSEEERLIEERLGSILSPRQVWDGNLMVRKGDSEWSELTVGKPIQYKRPTEAEIAFLNHKALSPRLRQLQNRAIDLEIRACQVDRHYWLCAWVRTQDEHDRDEPIKHWPLNLPYQQFVTRLWDYKLPDGTYPPQILAKSRQMMVSWHLSALILHEAMYRRSCKAFVQSQKEWMADRLLKDKIVVIWENLPAFLKSPMVIRKCHLEFKRQRSHIFAVPAGEDQARSFTATVWFSDEAAFQDNFGKTYAAILPMIEGGGRFWAVSTANPSDFESILKGKT